MAGLSPGDVPWFHPSLRTPHKALNELSEQVRNSMAMPAGGQGLLSTPMGTFIPPPGDAGGFTFDAWTRPESKLSSTSVANSTTVTLNDPFISFEKTGYWQTTLYLAVTSVSGNERFDLTYYISTTTPTGAGSFFQQSYKSNAQVVGVNYISIPLYVLVTAVPFALRIDVSNGSTGGSLSFAAIDSSSQDPNQCGMMAVRFRDYP